jgi:hypothetical protein
MARRLNLDGDGQGDLIGHGGEHRAVFVYQIDCYRYWQRELGRNDFTFGQFGDRLIRGEMYRLLRLPDRECPPEVEPVPLPVPGLPRAA